MAKAPVCDFLGNELRAGDVITYSSRRGNGVRVSEAVIESIKAPVIGGRLSPRLVVRPTGRDSGWRGRRTLTRQWISLETVVFVWRDE